MLGRIKNKSIPRNTAGNLQNIMDKDKQIMKAIRGKRDCLKGNDINLATDSSSAVIYV